MTPRRAAEVVFDHLGRRPDDAFEAAVVLESVAGLTPSAALDLAMDAAGDGAPCA
jgi:hypothetical protein